MKRAAQLLDELVNYVEPPAGIPIVLTERPPRGPTGTNWAVGTGVLTGAEQVRYFRKLTELRRTDPVIDWSEVALDDRPQPPAYCGPAPSAGRSLESPIGGHHRPPRAKRAGRADQRISLDLIDQAYDGVGELLGLNVLLIRFQPFAVEAFDDKRRQQIGIGLGARGCT